MTLRYYEVSELPYNSRETLVSPQYWERPPDDWVAHVNPHTNLYGNGVTGSTIVYMPFKPESHVKAPYIDGYGEILLIDVREMDKDFHRATIEDGEMIASFGWFPEVAFKWHGCASEYQNWNYAINQSKGYAWGYTES